MQSQMPLLKLAAATLVFLSLGTAVSAQAGPPKTIVAVFSEDDPEFAETITLYADGKYQQSETVKKTSLYGTNSVHGFGLPDGVPDAFRAPKRNGTWRVLDKEAGQPIVFKTLAGLPKNAVIEVKAAMPFGVTWEHQSPYQSYGDRTLPAASFQAAPLPTGESSRKILVLGDPLPPLIKH